MKYLALLFSALLFISCQTDHTKTDIKSPRFELIVLGIAQDAGFPQAGCTKEQCQLYWSGNEEKRSPVSLGLVDNETHQAWMFEATPDFKDQLHHLSTTTQAELKGIFLTHAHMGHYTGLMHLGREVMGASKMPVYALPKMANYLSNNGPWSQLVSLQNIAIEPLQADSSIQLTPELSVTPFLVPHRDEFSETVGFKINAQGKSILFIPDINKWNIWERSITDEIANVDIAFIDGTFYDADELPGRDMNEIPHPFIEESIELFKNLSESEKAKITFIHFNHTNPLLLNTPERALVEQQGFNVATQGQTISLD